MLRAEHVSYSPTHEDVLWLKRAVQAEGPPRARVAATLVNKFMWARARLNSRRTLAQFVRAYAQPVNPRWFIGGDLYEAKVRNPKLTEKQRSAERNAALLRERVHSTRDSFKGETESAVQQALTSAPELRDATDYAKWDAPGKPGMVALTQAVPGTNRFWRAPAAEGWAGYTTALAAVPLEVSGGALVFVAGCALALYLVRRHA